MKREGLEEWAVVERMLPVGWEAQAKQLGALRRCRGFEDAKGLLRVMLIHLGDGCSLRETAVRAREGGLAQVSDVALLKRLKHCQAWFRWMTDGLMRQWVAVAPEQIWGNRRVRVVDGSVITEPGATGSTWRLHYSTTLPDLHCDEVAVTTAKVGESLQRFQVHAGEVLIADRGFAHRNGVRHVGAAGGDVIVRLNLTNLPLVDPLGRKPFALLPRLRRLKIAQVGDWPVAVLDDQGRIAGRVCAIKKSRQAAALARQRTQRENSRKGHRVQPQTLEAAGYIFVFTTVAGTQCPTESVLEMYRGRWQVELAFKRLKSLLALGHLKKTDPEGAKAWLQGKLLVAFLIEALIAAGERFSPWGYPLAAPTLSMARDFPDAPLAQ
jgi:hypothetical protein